MICDPFANGPVFALPPGADFPRALVAGLQMRMAGQEPEAMGRVTLYLNTAKMLARVRAAFQETGPGFLPNMRLVSDLGNDPVKGLPAAIPPLRRRLELARLVGQLVSREADFAPGTPVYDLADSLALLMDEMHSEGVTPAVLERPGLADDHALHWERSLKFLRIIAGYFDAGATPDPEGRQRLVIEALLSKWRAQPPDGLVIVAGSTGSRGATALLMEAVARLPRGALVLPGFDFDMPDMAWDSLTSGVIPNEDHPQYRYARLLTALGIQPAQVSLWAETAKDTARNRLISLALRPAPVTDQWLSEGSLLAPIDQAVGAMSLLEAPTARSEALAIALILREAAEHQRKAVLVTPDRVLVRRVVAALDRWGIYPDDSAGKPLHLSAPGRLLRHVAGLFGRPVTVETLLVLLKHPLTATGAGDRGNHLRFTRDLELKLRRSGPPFPKGQDLRSWASADLKRQDWAEWLAGWLETLPEGSSCSLLSYTETLFRLSETLAAGPGGQVSESQLWQQEAGRAALRTLNGLRDEAQHGGDLTPAGFAELLGAILRKETVRDIEAAHPFIAIQGAREARELQAELVILAGLNEGIWPQAPAPDPWLSRQMRLKSGLLLPERQIGLSAHDFQQAIAAPRVVLARAIRDDEAQTVPSRWLDRLTNLLTGLEGEAGVLRAMRDRGQAWIDLAMQLDQVPELPAAHRPAPMPPVEARPRELPVTAIRGLIRDPYAVYARYILRLRPLDPLLPQPDARLRGMVLHKIVEEFVGQRPADETLSDARARLLLVAQGVLQDQIPWASAQRIWLARIARIADRFVSAEAVRAAQGTPVILESGGKIQLGNLNFTLAARPDRIDQLGDGSLHIYDYKSGASPTKGQQTYFEKQLPLEAAMAERGAFEKIGPHRVSAVTFIELGGDGVEKTTSRDDCDPDAHWAGLLTLIGHYLKRTSGFPSRRAVFEAKQEGDYDHLARFGEWQMSDRPSPEDVG